MSDHGSVDPVVAGVPYVVASVNDSPPENLFGCVDGSVVAVTVASARQVVNIHGCARQTGESVVLYEKDRHGLGKDVRTWQVLKNHGRVEATVRPRF